MGRQQRKEDPELTSSHGHTEATTTYNAAPSGNNLRTSRTILPQLKKDIKKSHIDKGRRGREPNCGCDNP